MASLRKVFSRFFLSWHFFVGLALLVLLYTTAYLFPTTLYIVHGAAILFGLICLYEYWILFSFGEIKGSRTFKDKLSNGDENKIEIHLESTYPQSIHLEIIDELPVEWQVRNFLIQYDLKAKERKSFPYFFRPVRRGNFVFGHVQVLVSIQPGFLKRRFTLAEEAEVQVFPSYISMLKYEYLAISNTLVQAGIKKIRRIGQQTEFEKIREYIPGDEFRVINWKATARRNKLMANTYQDERSQQVYCIIDKGRVMDQPFNRMSLLDYAINASLVLSNIAIKKYDKAGILTFDEQEVQMLPAHRKSGQMLQIQELLFKQETRFLESDYDRLFFNIKRQIPQRSLLVLFTNFDTVNAMERRLRYLKQLSRNHLLLVVFFDNTETLSLIQDKAKNLQQVYHKLVAEKMRYEKEQIVSELRKHGIISLLSKPEDLTINTINRYLELKARGLI
ncbi:MAG: DUF58 domain-containing protein [Bacteroidetes bacterium]|nr:DUF58 domain-containing protein [Bacteroidota bacterium]